MPHARICSSCRRRYTGSSCQYCPPERVRLLDQPWRQVYKTKAWKVARALRLEHDGYRCTYVGNGAQGRCAEREGVDVHHHPPLRELWETGGDPYDQKNLRTLCRYHHGQAEMRGAAQRRARRRRFRPADAW